MTALSEPQGLARGALGWLLLAQALVLVPHVAHLPAWIWGLWALCVGWRIQVARMRARYPGTLAKAGLLVLVAAGVYFSRGSLVGLEAGTVLLVATFALKLVEMRSRRDALVVIFLGFFVVTTGYLFEDGILAALLSMFSVCALLAALIGLQQNNTGWRAMATLRLASTLMLQALPLMLLLFLFFPRLAPLWSLPQPDRHAYTGLSESMAPGDIAELSRSAELVFRASFDGPLPPRERLYWRALTLDAYDGRRWSQSAWARAWRTPPAWQRQGPALDYSVVMQPSGQRWLFSLDTAEAPLASGRMLGDFRLQRPRPVEAPLLYRLRSWPQALREPDGDAQALRQALTLPAAGEPRARAWAAQLKAQYTQPEARVQAVLARFAREPYVYTLQPPTLGENPVDAFLFDSRRGFCAHYAGAMTFVLRAAGIPARVVTGYQGGEYNPGGGYLSVRQFDAHAWVEYWQEGVGWRSVDPTFQVSPLRIEQGLEQAVAQERSFLADSPLSMLRFRDIGWLNQLRLSWENLNYDWQRWVLNYQSEAQGQLLRRWFGALQGSQLLLGLLGVAALLLAMLGLYLLKPWRRERDPLARRLARFEALLARRGVSRAAGEGMQAFAARAAMACPPAAASIARFAALYVAQRYAAEPSDLAALDRALRELRRRRAI